MTVQRALATVGLIAAVGCTAPVPSAVVEVDADSAVRRDGRVLVLTVLEGAERIPRLYHERRGPALRWPAYLELDEPPAGDGDFRVIARVTGDDGEPVSYGMLLGHRDGAQPYYRLFLDDECAAHSCSEARDETCRRGICASAEAGGGIY